MIFDFKKIIKNFVSALNGLKITVREQTFRSFLVITVLVIILAIFLKVSFYESLFLILVITFVMALELINSQIERILDIFQPNHDLRVKAIKDISAGAVLLACLGAAVIGILIFLPYLL